MQSFTLLTKSRKIYAHIRPTDSVASFELQLLILAGNVISEVAKVLKELC